MDLFEDLPPPASKSESFKLPQSSIAPTLSSTPSTAEGIPVNPLFDDLPPAKEQDDMLIDASSKRKPEPLDGEPQKKISKVDLSVLNLTSFSAERKGERLEMQDAHVLIDDLLPHLVPQHPSLLRAAYYAVFDGHGGARASKYAAENLHRNIVLNFPKGTFEEQDKYIKKCFIDSFKKTDDDFLKEARAQKPSWKDGTTAVSVLILNNKVYIANLGDSKAILCRYHTQHGKYVGVSLTKDHTPSVYSERQRIYKAGGQVKDGRVMGVLEVSRSIGDGPYKNHGMSCIPDIRRCEIMPNDRYLLLACDGLWKTFTNETAIEFLDKILSDASIGASGSKPVEEVRYETACSRITAEAVRRLSADNVTVILIAISQHTPGKR